MASAIEMGEVDDIHSKDENVTDGVVMNGDLVAEDISNSKAGSSPCSEPETMEVDEKSDDEGMEVNNIDDKDEEDHGLIASVSIEEADDVEDGDGPEDPEDGEDPEEIDEVEEIDDVEDVTEVEDGVAIEELEDGTEVEDVDDVEDVEDEEREDVETNSNAGTLNSAASIDEDGEVHNIDDDDEDNSDDEVRGEVEVKENSDEDDEDTVVINDSAEIETDGDVMIVDNDPVKENGMVTPEKNHNKISDTAQIKKVNKPKVDLDLTPRRSGRNANKSKSYVLDSDKEQSPSEESDVEEVLPQDPLAVSDPLSNDKISKKSRNSSTIVVKDTKRLVEIASKTTPGSAGKKEPTLVIIDTNSILSGRGPIPLSQKQKQSSTSTYHPVLPVALPAQGVYPANMRATITPIPMNNPTPKQTSIVPATTITPPTPILPSLTDDMFVVEAPSFIVPYVYEKPPVKDLKEFVKNMANEIRKMIEEEKIRELEEEKKNEKSNEGEDSKDTNDDDDEESTKKDDKSDVEDVDDKKDDINKPHTYFDSPIGKFYVDIGSGLVQEFVQTDLLKQQKRKRDRESGQNSATMKTIQSLLKSLEYTKENNRPYKMAMKKCEFCSYKTESALAMAFHLETPHMKNFVYKCNFCPFEVRSPHDILFHMEAEHCVRGRLERAPAFHQCPNCPFEDNQKGKLSRHTVACARKFKPERNLEPPIDWEPPAKIPRAPRMKQQSLSTTAAMYQAMNKNSQMQFMKMQQNMQQTALNRGRGRPALGMPSKQHSVVKSPGVYKTSVPGGASVLVPTNYQISGNQLYQVLGGQELGSRIGGPMGGYIPSMSAPSSTVTIQNSTNKTKTVHQPSISITPLPRGTTGTSLSNTSVSPSTGGAKPGDSNSKNSFVICEICDGYIKDLEQLRNHMQWIHKVKIHPKMIYNRPPLNCQKCQFRFFTDQGLERHLLGSHGLVTSSMQEAANKCKDSGRCPVCGRVYQWKLLNHVARDHNMTLKPAHLSYKCTVCTATFGMYKQFENHVYSAHSVVAKRSMDKKASTNSPSKGESLLKPLKINDEITIIPQMPKSNGAGSSKEGSPSSNSKHTSGNSKIGDTSISRADRLARRKTSLIGDN